MNPLRQLKERLQIVLNESAERCDFHYALEDAVYACGLDTEAALLNWSTNWINDDKTSLPEADLEYARGVAFVEEQWHKITGMF